MRVRTSDIAITPPRFGIPLGFARLLEPGGVRGSAGRRLSQICWLGVSAVQVGDP
jgi:hypothetical protein